MILNFYIPAEVCDEIERETCVFLKVPDCKEDFIEECIKTITNECRYTGITEYQKPVAGIKLTTMCAVQRDMVFYILSGPKAALMHAI